MHDTHTSLEVLALLDAQLQFRCEHGAQQPPQCQYAADWTVLVHDCHAEHGFPLLLCEWHYLRLHQWITELLELGDGKVVLPCGFIVTRVEDYVWNARRLHA